MKMSLSKKLAKRILPFIALAFILLACGHSVKKTPETEVAQPKQDRVAIEFILKNEVGKDSLINLFKETQLECFSWKNHIVLFGNAADTVGLQELVGQTNEAYNIQRYLSPMYIFDKATNCQDTTVEKPWKNYLLTANLVADTVLQQEYVNYHATQFEEWPEVAQGFCHANFQQLLVYKNARQLLLVISIPADKTLDDLNPLTVENNPRMDEWNSIMGKYQEGIEGTATGETWVFLDKVE